MRFKESTEAITTIMEKTVENDKVIVKSIKDVSEVGLFPRELKRESEVDLFPKELKRESEVDQSSKEISNLKEGGRYGDIFIGGEGSKYEVHHMPADSVSNLERNDGPAIKMEKGDHRQTASCGNSKEAREYRDMQKKLIQEGKFREALQMDIDDIHEKFGDKYDKAISEMLEYVNKIELEGKING